MNSNIFLLQIIRKKNQKREKHAYGINYPFGFYTNQQNFDTLQSKQKTVLKIDTYT